MKAEIIAVGTELLMGQIVNTNAQYLARGLADIGVGVYYQTVVGDNASRMKEALRLAKSRVDLVICTGGLGPTQDDLTKDVLAEVLGQSLVMHQPSLDKMIALFEGRGIPMVESNKRQALMLEHSEPLANDTGLAVGVAVTHEGTHYILLPGPPKEMKPMFDNYARRWIDSNMDNAQPLYSLMVKFAGIGESSLEHELIDLIESQSDPTIAPYAKEGEVAIRLTTRATSADEAAERLQPLEKEIRSRLGEHIYASEDISLEQHILRTLATQGKKLAVAESCSGGHLSDMLTAVPGSSDAFVGGVICYSNAMKHKLLGIPMEQLESDGSPGAVSEETAAAMAENVTELTGADFGISITGVAGPGESEGKPVGLVYVGIAKRGEKAAVVKLLQPGNRESIKLRASKNSLYHLWNLLKS
ncbi:MULTISPECIES: competence/damage-inducible protein A [unclassified Paenibacillus]|uniref:competence/damage-inducible protein A n=1 Tax=unclassified Paenibacillus TaxID=185978 RepID=UPI001AE5FCE5|nr:MULTISPECIES: competence/damage-inducible protein A [unclassified Paenibacillus]MBP1155933.1 nicotinamide-nucleotide amidase [Paenibacillus sp. PvP091]MBP1168681.1 nicotinamide-nucleotide amidase [Paenibacillus sp. PvR098]MBP2439709.1 nicotinamide-nucleotide amidase [Paenibacillus sp. PvP052]